MRQFTWLVFIRAYPRNPRCSHYFLQIDNLRVAKRNERLDELPARILSWPALHLSPLSLRMTGSSSTTSVGRRMRTFAETWAKIRSTSPTMGGIWKLCLHRAG